MIHSFIYSFIQFNSIQFNSIQFIHSFIHSSIHLFIYLFIHSSIPLNQTTSTSWLLQVTVLWTV